MAKRPIVNPATLEEDGPVTEQALTGIEHDTDNDDDLAPDDDDTTLDDTKEPEVEPVLDGPVTEQALTGVQGSDVIEHIATNWPGVKSGAKVNVRADEVDEYLARSWIEG